MNTENAQPETVQNGPGDLDDLEMLQLEAEKEDTGAGTKQTDPLNILYKHHPEAVLDYKETVFQKLPLKSAPPFTEEDLDMNHKSQPFLTQYEKTRILGFRTNQLAQGARPLLLNGVPEHVKTTLEIARLELEQRRLPFVVKRPMPDGSFEYWRLSDLLIL
jgi:DNA-directed RNA polymerase I, II, and III subunit RPABC2